MSNCRGIRIPGAKYFFAVSMADRSSDLLVREVAQLRVAIALTRLLWCRIIGTRFGPCHREMRIFRHGGG
ncbi:hypothetical protein [Ruegeria sp. A3M17]|uniref:hypothetical protein n=1 Tax=Ruegeria sp. A3M17 TaxID=2267229 RepID=UPI003514958B